MATRARNGAARWLGLNVMEALLDAMSDEPYPLPADARDPATADLEVVINRLQSENRDLRARLADRDGRIAQLQAESAAKQAIFQCP